MGTISAFPYYSFEDRTMAYTIGSAFYGIYFVVSFPAFYYLDFGDATAANKNGINDNKDESNNNENNNNYKRRKTTATMTLLDVFISSCGYGMVILCLLD